jgi:hypothetical protein
MPPSRPFSAATRIPPDFRPTVRLGRAPIEIFKPACVTPPFSAGFLFAPVRVDLAVADLLLSFTLTNNPNSERRLVKAK